MANFFRKTSLNKKITFPRKVKSKSIIMGNKTKIMEIEKSMGKEIDISERHNVYEGYQNSSEQNSLINSFVVNTLTNGCCFRWGSFDQTGTFNLDASAIKSISFLCGIDSALCKNSLYSSMGINSTKIAISLNNSLNSCLEIPVFSNISLEFLLISSNDSSGAENSKSWSTNNPLVNESFQKYVNNTFVSTTNFIYINPLFFNWSYLPYLEALCNLTDQSIISFSSSKCFINLFTNKATPNFSASCFNSSGISMQNSTILTDNIENHNYLSFSIEKNLSGFKLQKITGTYSEFNSGKEVYEYLSLDEMNLENGLINKKSIGLKPEVFFKIPNSILNYKHQKLLKMKLLTQTRTAPPLGVNSEVLTKFEQ